MSRWCAHLTPYPGQVGHFGIDWIIDRTVLNINHLTWWRHQMKHFLRYWPSVKRIHRWPVNSPHKGQLCGTLIYFFYPLLNKRLTSLWRHCNETSGSLSVQARYIQSYEYLHIHFWCYGSLIKSTTKLLWSLNVLVGRILSLIALSRNSVYLRALYSYPLYHATPSWWKSLCLILTWLMSYYILNKKSFWSLGLSGAVATKHVGKHFVCTYL